MQSLTIIYPHITFRVFSDEKYLKAYLYGYTKVLIFIVSLYTIDILRHWLTKILIYDKVAHQLHICKVS